MAWRQRSYVNPLRLPYLNLQNQTFKTLTFKTLTFKTLTFKKEMNGGLLAKA